MRKKDSNSIWVFDVSDVCTRLRFCRKKPREFRFSFVYGFIQSRERVKYTKCVLSLFRYIVHYF